MSTEVQPKDPYATWDPARATNDPDGLPDRKMVPVIAALRSKGITTYQSCQGHSETDSHGGFDGHIWIDLDSVVDHFPWSPDVPGGIAQSAARALVATRVYTSVSLEFGREHLPVLILQWGPPNFDAAIRELFRLLSVQVPEPIERQDHDAEGSLMADIFNEPRIRSALQGDLTKLLNEHGADQASNTPDHILSRYLMFCLENFAAATTRRDQWHS